MRADRLLSILFLLQSRGQLTAEQLAAELEVSTRTIYRDIDALSIAGVPLYADHGPGGGYALLDSYRTNLTGLTEAEVRALFMLSIPAPLADLGVDQELKMALRKVSAALPTVFRADEQWVRQRIHLDAAWWFQRESTSPHLKTVHEAIRQDLQVRIRYRPWYALPAEVDQLIDPYGLVAKAGVWYLVYAYAGRIRARRVSELLDANLCESHFQRPDDFDLPAFWRQWRADYEEEKRPHYPVTVSVNPELIPLLKRIFGDTISEAIAATPGDDQGRIKLELSFESLEAARAQILNYGMAAEVLEPAPLRQSIIDFAEQIIARYKNGKPKDN